MKILPGRLILPALWLINLMGILGLSIFGRRIQHWLADLVGYSTIAWLIGSILLGLIVAYLNWLKPRLESIPWFHLCWFLALFLLGPFYFERVEERFHFISFGLFGVLSILIFSHRVAFLCCLGISMGDEVLQHFLVDRVGAWADVWLNMTASVAAAWFVLLTLSGLKTRLSK